MSLFAEKGPLIKPGYDLFGNFVGKDIQTSVIGAEIFLMIFAVVAAGFIFGRWRQYSEHFQEGHSTGEANSMFRYL